MDIFKSKFPENRTHSSRTGQACLLISFIPNSHPVFITWAKWPSDVPCNDSGYVFYSLQFPNIFDEVGHTIPKPYFCNDSSPLKLAMMRSSQFLLARWDSWDIQSAKIITQSHEAEELTFYTARTKPYLKVGGYVCSSVLID